MIKIASGEELAFTQDDVGIDGWAIESRLYAEDPYRSFLPSIGRLTAYAPPPEGPVGIESDAGPIAEGPGGREIGGGAPIIRNDTGVTEGSEISMFYDPMIAKLCTWAPTRDEATDAMADALDAFVVDGIGHNIPFLSAIMAHPKWRSGDISTKFIEEEYPDGFEGAEPSDDALRNLAVAAALVKRVSIRRPLGTTTGGNLHVGVAPASVDVFIGGERLTVEATPADGGFEVIADGDDLGIVTLDWRRGGPLARLTIDGRTETIRVDPATAGYRLRHGGVDLIAKVYSSRVADLAALMPVKEAPDTSNLLLCPMPGLVVSLMVKEGERVEEGQPLVIIEAMKMENVLRAERAATVKRLAAVEGDSLAVDQTIMEFEV